MLQLLEERGVVDRVMQSLQLGGSGEVGEGRRRRKEGECGDEGVKEGRRERVSSDDDRLDERTGEETPKKG